MDQDDYERWQGRKHARRMMKENPGMKYTEALRKVRETRPWDSWKSNKEKTDE